jgi:hypothetical protein
MTGSVDDLEDIKGYLKSGKVLEEKLQKLGSLKAAAVSIDQQIKPNSNEKNHANINDVAISIDHQNKKDIESRD